MNEKMYNDLMAHIDNLEVWGFMPSLTAFIIRKYIKASEEFALTFYNFYFGGVEEYEV